jgi:hypothetical protein
MNRLVIPCVVLALLASDAASFGLDLIRDGQAVSTIVVPAQASELEKQGAETLAKYLKLASGAELPVVPESPGLQGTRISVGKTEMAEAAGITDQGLKYDGYRIAVKGGCDQPALTASRRAKFVPSQALSWRPRTTNCRCCQKGGVWPFPSVSSCWSERSDGSDRSDTSD